MDNDKNKEEVFTDGERAETEVELKSGLSNFLGLDPQSEKFKGWKEKFPDISERDLMLACLYNRITREQSRWAKRSDLPQEIMTELDDFIHSTSNATAEVIVNKRLGQNLQRIEEARVKLLEVAVRAGVEPKAGEIEVEPEPNILSFEKALLSDKERPFLEDPLLVVGLTTHGDIPAYVVSKLLFKKGIVSGVALIRPTSRDGREDVSLMSSDRVKLDEARGYAKNILVVDDSIEKGASMEQALGFLDKELSVPKTVFVAVSLEVPFLQRIEGEEYDTISHGGKTIYKGASFFRPKKT